MQKILWSRSVEKDKLRYVTMLCDRDSKSDLQVYGDDKQIKEGDCLNHVSRRMDTALRKLIETSKAKGCRISDKGKVTEDMVLKIQNDYGKAVKEHSDSGPLLKKRSFAILFSSKAYTLSPRFYILVFLAERPCKRQKP